MWHACCCRSSTGAEQFAIPADVVLTIRSACQAYTLSQYTSRARTVTYARVMHDSSIRDCPRSYATHSCHEATRELRFLTVGLRIAQLCRQQHFHDMLSSPGISLCCTLNKQGLVKCNARKNLKRGQETMNEPVIKSYYRSPRQVSA
jgi:hypothetical protein